MCIGEPLRALIVEAGRRAGLEFLCRRLVAGDRTFRIAGNGYVDPFHPFGRVEPAVAEFDQPPRGLCDGNGARVVRVVGGGDVWRKADREPEEQRCLVPRRGELARLGRALDAYEARWPEAVAAIWLLALTGCRRSEVLNLRWSDIGEDAINLADSKTGPRAVPLGEAARALIETPPGPRKPKAFLFPSFAE